MWTGWSYTRVGCRHRGRPTRSLRRRRLECQRETERAALPNRGGPGDGTSNEKEITVGRSGILVKDGMHWLLLLIAYLIGAVPFALLLARRIAGTDVRSAGSGNVGAANVYRTTHPSLALAVMVLDVGKGCAVVVFAGSLGGDETLRAAAGAAAIVGHVFPVWLRFRGGKGVATACGVFAVLSPLATAMAAAMFVVVVWFTRYVSLGSVVASLAFLPLAYFEEARPATIACAIAMALLILVRHRANFARLQAGTEWRLESSIACLKTTRR